MTRSTEEQLAASRSLIGPDTRIEGDISFCGTLRTDGRIVGNVRCRDLGPGAVVVGEQGSVAGGVSVRQAVVGGQVEGNIEATESVDIRPTAVVRGDLQYRQLHVEPGARIDGRLKPMDAAAGSMALPETGRERPLVLAGEAPAVPTRGRPNRLVAALGVGIVAVLATTLVALRPPSAAVPADPAPPAAAIAPPADAVPAAPPVVAAPAEPAAPPPVSQPAAPAAEVPLPTAPATKATPSSPPPPSGSTFTLRGDNPDKPANLVFVVSSEAAVLEKRGASDPSRTARIELTAGTSKRIAIAPGEVIGLAEGLAPDIYFQGRKLAPDTLKPGRWIAFQPAN